MPSFDRPYTTFYWFTIVIIALSGNVFELFDIEWYHDLEIWVWDHWSSLKQVPFESLGAVSYSHSIVTMVLFCIICQIKWYIGGKSWFFIPPLHLASPLGESPSEYHHPVWCGKTKMVGQKNFEDMYNHLDSIPACDRRTDRRTDAISSLYAWNIILQLISTRQTAEHMNWYSDNYTNCRTFLIIQFKHNQSNINVKWHLHVFTLNWACMTFKRL